MSSTFLLSARRSAVSPRGGAFAGTELHDLAAPVIKSVLDCAGLDASRVGEVIVGNSLGAGGNPARLAALAAGLPDHIAGLTIDRQCCGGLDALLLADAMIRSGQAEIVVAGGVESYSRRPLRCRTFPDDRPSEFYDQPPFTPWPDRDPDMAEAANSLAQKLGISRAEQDEWAVESHRKALAAKSRMSHEEIVPIAGRTSDRFARPLSERTCVRAATISGSITSANTSVAADAAAFCVLASEETTRKLCDAPIRFVSGVTLGADPELPGLAPVPAIKRSLEISETSTPQLTCVEIMEAYAVQAIACQKLTEIDAGIVNVGGGSLARGHPIGASGAILAVRLFHELKRRKGRGLAAIAAAGGLGTSVIFEA